MAAVSTEKWVKFFTKAGIPPRAATTYALTFADNRIQLDMLLDLNKEYLRDMGITLMGDVIAILRHAREVHEELTHEKLLAAARNPTNPVKPITNVRESSNSTAAAAKVMRSTKVPVKASPQRSSSSSYSSSSTSSPSSSPPSPPKKVSVSSRISDPNSSRSSTVGRPSGLSGVLSTAHASTSVKNSIKKIEPQTESLKRRSGEISRPKLSIEKQDIEEIPVPAKKVRRVLPEHEGGYKIKMPSGTTPRSQEILAKQKEIVSKKTVFDRLGGSTSPSSPSADPPAVSSTTSDPSFTVTGVEGAKKAKISSVFSRLGDKQVSSTSVAAVVEGTLPYAGILKNAVSKPVQRAPAVVQKTSSMVADSLPSSNRSDVQSRIGALKEMMVMKRSATLVSVPALKRTATVVTVPKQVPEIRRTATVVTIPRPAKMVKTEGILAGFPSTVSRPVKSRLGSEDSVRTPKVSVVKQTARTTIPSIKQRVELSRANGNVLAIPSKKVTFSGTTGKLASRSNVFSRLGS